MSALGWVGVGALAWLVIGVAIGCVLDGDVRDGLARVLMAPTTLPVIWLAGVGLRLPRWKRHRVTPESLHHALHDENYEHETVSIGWPRGALVLLRSRPRAAEQVERETHPHTDTEES